MKPYLNKNKLTLTLSAVVIILSITSCSKTNKSKDIDFNKDIYAVTNYENNNTVTTRLGIICQIINNTLECRDIFGDIFDFTELSKKCTAQTQCNLIDQSTNSIYLKKAYFCETMLGKRSCATPLTHTCLANNDLRFWFNIQKSYGKKLKFKWYFDGKLTTIFHLPENRKNINTDRYRGSASHYIPGSVYKIELKILTSNNKEIGFFTIYNNC